MCTAGIILSSRAIYLTGKAGSTSSFLILLTAALPSDNSFLNTHTLAHEKG
jgi:hypothetical protein